VIELHCIVLRYCRRHCTVN